MTSHSPSVPTRTAERFDDAEATLGTTFSLNHFMHQASFVNALTPEKKVVAPGVTTVKTIAPSLLT